MKSRNLFIVALFFALPACSGDVKETLGMRRDAPDEFAVERRPKLDVPPEFKLRPPLASEDGLKESQIRDELQANVLGSSTLSSTGNAEAVLLEKTGAGAANPEIRKIISKEYGSENPDLLERIESISDDTTQKTLVDAEKERERISQNKKSGKAITEGESAARSKSGTTSVLDKILGE
jgi:hypothetical protein